MLGLFLKLCFKHSDATQWKIGGWIIDINSIFLSLLGFHEIVTQNELSEEFKGVHEMTTESFSDKLSTLKKLIYWDGEPKLGGWNQSQKKFMSLVSILNSTDTNYAYLDVWDIDESNLPRLNFVGNVDQSSFEEIEDIFVRFLAASNEDELDNFRSYLKERYPINPSE